MVVFPRPGDRATLGSDPSTVTGPHFPSPEHPHGDAGQGFASPSIHFRHYGRANVLWCDGHITSERMDWAPETNIYGAKNARWNVGWFGPRNNLYFDAGDKGAFGTEGLTK